MMVDEIEPYKEEEGESVEQEVCNKYRVLQTFQYNTYSEMLEQQTTIEVGAGMTFHRILDEPENFSDGLTIIPESVIEANPNVFDPIKEWEKS